MFAVSLFSSDGFMPHGHCYLWDPRLLSLHVISDVLIGLAYASISLTLYILVRQIRLPFSPMFLAFGAFIGFCGLTHFMEVFTVWNPDYWLSGIIKAVTAVASVATGILLFPVKPKVIQTAQSAALSEERRIKLESTNAELETLYNKVKEVDELKTQFFANVSHELRTPLALILGPLEKLLSDKNLNLAQKKDLSLMSRNAKRLLKQVNDILDVTKLEAGKLMPSYQEFDIVKLLKVVASYFDSGSTKKFVNVHVHTPASLLIQADSEQIERVLLNLVSNAYKFVPEKGHIEINLEVIEPNLVISVSDDGPGVKPELREIVFDRFRQGDASATREFGGTGLGLSIAKEFTELHRGRIELKDSHLGGACFVITMPQKAPQGTVVLKDLELYDGNIRDNLQSHLNAQDKPAERNVLPNDLPKVLVIEDNAEMSDFIVNTLEGRFNVATAANGREALEKLENLDPDAVIADIMMPEMTGEEFVLTVRKQDVFENLPIIVLSAKADDEARTRILNSGAQDYLIKPFSRHELLARLSNLITIKKSKDILKRELNLATNDLISLTKEITVKKRELETALDSTTVAREEAEKANQAKGSFLSLVSHELRTPLTSMLLTLQVLESKNLETDKMGRLIGSTKRLKALIEGLLEYTRIESGKLSINSEPIEITALAKDSLDELELQARQKKLDLKLVIKNHVSPVLSDTRLINIIINNLLSNAIKYTEKGSVTLTLDQIPGRQLIVVTDTGNGIAEQDLDRIFNPFEQLEPVKRKAIPGVGLGLALVKKIVESLGGTISVNSKVGAGTMFTVNLPLRTILRKDHTLNIDAK